MSTEFSIKTVTTWAKKHRYLVVLLVLLVCLPVLWLVRVPIDLFLPVAINIAVLVSATYISLRPKDKGQIRGQVLILPQMLDKALEIVFL